MCSAVPRHVVINNVKVGELGGRDPSTPWHYYRQHVLNQAGSRKLRPSITAPKGVLAATDPFPAFTLP